MKRIINYIRKTIERDWLVTYQYVIAVIAVTAGCIFLFFNFSKLPPLVPLYYSLPWGEERLAGKAYLYLIPLLSIAIAWVNSVLILFTVRSYTVVTRLLAFAIMLCSLLGLYTLVRIVSIII